MADKLAVKRGVSRRFVLKAGATTAGVLALGGAAFTGRVAAEQDPQQIKCGQTRVSYLGPDDPTDDYTLVLEEETDVVIDMSVGTKRGDGDGEANGQDKNAIFTKDPLLRVFDSGGVEVAANDDGGEGFNARVVTTLPAGTYTIRAGDFGGFGPDEEGYNYRLTVDCS